METVKEKEWIENEIVKLERELGAAERHKAAAGISLDRAKAEYAAARETAETTAGLIRYFRGELGFIAEVETIDGHPNKKAPGNLREILEHVLKEERPAFELIGMRYLFGLAEGYFIDPVDPAYVHLWEIRVEEMGEFIYSDTLREIALFPIDGYQFPCGVVLTKMPDELNELGFNISNLFATDAIER
jgi:hypothetical protein